MREKVWVCDDDGSERFPVYTRGNVGEVFVEAASPLTWSAYGPHALDAGWRQAFCKIGLFTPDEFKPAGQAEILCCFGGYIYINMSVTRVLAVRIPGLTIEAIDRSLFGDYPDVPPYRPDPRDENPERTAAVGAWLQSLFSEDPRPATDRDQSLVLALTARRPRYAELADADLLSHFRDLRTPQRDLFERHVLNRYGTNVLMSVVAQSCQAAGLAHLTSKLTVAEGDIDSATQTLEIWDLSRQVRASSTLTRLFADGVDSVLERLRAIRDPVAEEFLGAWEGFMTRWGFMGPSLWEFRSPIWHNNPDIPLRMIDRARQAPDSAAPAARVPSLVADREAAIAEVSARLAKVPDMQEQFSVAVRAAANYLSAGERSKMNCAILLDEARSAIRELGLRLVRRGLLRRWEDVLLVTDAEADEFVAHPEAFSGMILERAARLEVLRSKEPPFVFEGAPPPLSAYRDRGVDRIELAGSGVDLAGIGVSPGAYTGRARVITSLEHDGELEPGDVLVAVTTDASWGPLFLSAGAIVVETGAPISHAAIVSRELGIPAVVSVTNATRRIRDGATVTVDGGAGVVTVH